MRNKPKMPPKFVTQPGKTKKKAPPSGKNPPGVSYVYRKDAFNKVKIA